MASDSKSRSRIYRDSGADKEASKDLAAPRTLRKQASEKIQKALDKGINFEKMKAAAVGCRRWNLWRHSAWSARPLNPQKLDQFSISKASRFDNLADAAGTSSKRILDSLKQSSQGLVAESDLMAAAGKAMLMSIPADKISELMKIAAATSKMTGQSITEAFNDITMGVARQSRMILDNLGHHRQRGRCQ